MKQMEDRSNPKDKPKKSRRKNPKSSTSDDDMIDSDTLEDKIITGAIESYLEQYKERKLVNQDNIEMLSSFLEEFLESFLIIGYNYDGEVVNCTSARTQAQVDALNTGIMRYISQYMTRDNTPPPTWRT
jgi:hypothetical protein